MTPNSTSILSAFLLAAMAGGTAFGQSVVPPSGVAAAAKEEAVELTPFTVTSDKDVGYQAANTLAGSRMNTSLKDTAASISILTEEFIKDVGAMDLNEAIRFGNNVEMELPDGNASFEFFRTFVIRGQRPRSPATTSVGSCRRIPSTSSESRRPADPTRFSSASLRRVACGHVHQAGPDGAEFPRCPIGLRQLRFAAGLGRLNESVVQQAARRPVQRRL